MPSQPLHVLIPVQCETVQEAVTHLSGHYLRSARGGVKVITDPTEFNVGTLSHALLEDWQSGKAPYQPGEITLIFTEGKLSAEADLVIYRPLMGDRLLYTRPVPPGTAKPVRASRTKAALHEDASQIGRHLATLNVGLAELTDWQRAVEGRLQGLLTQAPLPTSSHEPASGLGSSLQSVLKLQSDAFSRQLRLVLDAQAEQFAQRLAQQLADLERQLSDRFTALQTQLDALIDQINTLQEPVTDEPLPPRTEAEWLLRFQDTWGTVGDYEQYSYSHREANAETPLEPTPDWVALCDLDWARKLNPALTLLYDLIHMEDGIGYTGADILQQFGRHVDPQTGDRYYIYQLNGFSAYEALWQTANHPQYSWLPELQRLARLSKRFQAVFELFGWEPEAVTSLESVVERTRYERHTTRDRQTYSQSRPNANPLSNYLALLNLGPFTPITLETLKRAYRQAMKVSHPDTGGSKEQAQKINEAYEALLRHYFPD